MGDRYPEAIILDGQDLALESRVFTNIREVSLKLHDPFSPLSDPDSCYDVLIWGVTIVLRKALLVETSDIAWCFECSD